MSFLDNILGYLPEIEGPKQKKLEFKEKLKWTLIILVMYFVLGQISLFGLGPNALKQFEFLSIILGAKFGSIISLGIGPLVTGSIVLQLLQGAGILKFDLHTTEGKKKFQGLQKITGVFFIVFEACIYVFMGGLAPPTDYAGTFAYTQLQLFLILQLFIGGLIIMFMDEVTTKWGFGSGISLFIAAGVSESIFISLLSPFTTEGILGFPFGEGAPIGRLFSLIYSVSTGNTQDATLAIASVLATVLVFVFAVYVQAMKVEIPLSFGRVRGYGIRWPLSFIYASNIPVILIAALIANIQIFATLLQKWGYPILGTFNGNTPASGFVTWVYAPEIIAKIIRGSVTYLDFAHSLSYILFMVVGSVIFGVFWVQTAGMDARSQAKNITASGLQMSGFRSDERVLERVLDRYVWPLTIMGSITVGILAASADLLGALSNGTGILLAVMIIYRLYEDIAKQHMVDMHPMLRKMME